MMMIVSSCERMRELRRDEKMRIEVIASIDIFSLGNMTEKSACGRKTLILFSTNRCSHLSSKLHKHDFLTVHFSLTDLVRVKLGFLPGFLSGTSVSGRGGCVAVRTVVVLAGWCWVRLGQLFLDRFQFGR